MSDELSNAMNQFKLFFFPIFIGSLAIVLIIVGVKNIYYAEKSLLWKVARGKVLESSYHSGGAKATHGSVSVQYEYFVNEVPYRNDRLSFSQAYNHKYGNEYFLDSMFKKGSDVNVYYDDKDQNNAVLIRGCENNSDDYSSIITGIFMLSISILAGYLQHRLRCVNRKMGSPRSSD